MDDEPWKDFNRMGRRQQLSPLTLWCNIVGKQWLYGKSFRVSSNQHSVQKNGIQTPNFVINNTDLVHSVGNIYLDERTIPILRITKVPFLQIIYIAMEHEWRALPQTFKILEQELSETLQQCQNRSVTEWASFFRKHGHDMDRNKQARLQMQSQVLLLSFSCPQHQESSVYTLASEDQLFQALDSLESSTDDNTLLVTMFHSHFEQSCVRDQYQFRKITATTSFSIYQNRSIVISDSTL
ncbi:hypothetical protein IV203_011310 [Nitzschia inconspicua]|uniref:Uncharacterized protein n=1 Tax=Nitzschia inconspicua TaxID=303405 RepID=A0A9K3KRU9_9STRA|nr:hypothetical protein IV203_011310 [Nitzschia inconspicua]